MIPRMPSQTITFHLDAPPERVFDYIADIRNEAEWSKDITSVELVGDGPIGPGTEFDTVYRGFGAMRLVLSEYQRAAHLTIDGDGPRIVMHFEMDLAPEGEGTSVTMLVDMKLRGAFKALEPVLKLGMPREMAKRPKQFAAALSGR
jgi:carbon monoxide dehydrogenase subunit G